MPKNSRKSKPATNEPSRSPALPDETVQALIQQESRIVRIALDGYMRLGRGAVLLQDGADRYAPLSELRRDHAAAASAVESYRPGQAVVVVRGTEVFSIVPRDGMPPHVDLVASIEHAA
jgi:hypothetical protein